MKNRSLVLLLMVLFCGLAANAQSSNAGYDEGSLSPNYAADTGAANTLVAGPAGCSAPVVGLSYRALPGHANTTTTPTLAWCGAAAKIITKFGTGAVAASDLTTTAVAVFYYDGTDMELQNPQTASSSGTVQDGGGTTTSGEICTSTGTAHVCGWNGNDIIASGGNFTTYDGMATAGVGLDTVLGVSDVTSQSASQTTVNILASTPAAGHYMVRLYLDQNALCTTGTGVVYATVGWTDATHARTATTVPLTLANTTNSTTLGFIDAAIPLWSATASAITYTTTYTGCATGTGTYDLHAAIARTN
jgi:hypothetical protein